MALVVRSSLRELDDEKVYRISTDQAKKYLQTKFDMIGKSLKARGVQFPDMKLVMYNQEIGKQFLPFILILPIEALENKEVEENIPSIFRADDEDRSVRLRKPIFDVLRNYTFNKDDKNAFRSPVWKREMKINGRVIGTLIKYSTPKIENFNRAGKKIVVFVNPIRLFHDMLVDESNNQQRFSVNIESWDKIEDGSYNFKVVRKINKEKGENRNTVYAQMLRKINGSN